MAHLKMSLLLLALSVLAAHAKPSHPYLHAVPDHFDFAAPLPHFHATGPLLPEPAPLIPYGAPVLPPPPPPPAPVHFYHAPPPAATVSVHTHFIPPAPLPLLPAPAPLLPAPAPVLPAAAPWLPAPLPLTRVLPPVFEPVPFAAPTYRAIPGPKTTTHHVSVGYAFPQPTLQKVFIPHHHDHFSIF